MKRPAAASAALIEPYPKGLPSPVRSSEYEAVLDPAAFVDPEPTTER